MMIDPHLHRYRPTLLGTLCQTAAVTRAIWSDYLEYRRLARRRARMARRHSLQQDEGLGLILLGLALAATALGVLFWAHNTGAWSVFVQWLGRPGWVL